MKHKKWRGRAYNNGKPPLYKGRQKRGGGGIRHMKNEKIDIKMAVASTYI